MGVATGGLGGGAEVIGAAFLLLGAAGLCFGVGLVKGPTIADRVNATNGLMLVGMSAVVIDAVSSGRGSFLPAVFVVSLVSFVGTGMVARYIEARSVR
jgi:multisubunit Na+/H+ antiporter MnhF subunit